MAKAPPPAPKPQVNVLAPIEQNYRQIDDNFTKLYAKCTTDEQREELRSILGAAEDAYWAAVADQLADLNDFVKDIRVDLEAKNKAIKKMLTDLQDVVQFLHLATEATRLAASLGRLAAI